MDNINKTIYEIVAESDSNRITVFTNHLKIDGFVYQCDGKCIEVANGILTLNNAIVCKIDDYCSCDDDDCSCNDIACFKYDWLNIMHSKIVSFSVLK